MVVSHYEFMSNFVFRSFTADQSLKISLSL